MHEDLPPKPPPIPSGRRRPRWNHRASQALGRYRRAHDDRANHPRPDGGRCPRSGNARLLPPRHRLLRRLGAQHSRSSASRTTRARRSGSPPSLDLITHPHAFTPDELHKLAEYGAARGVDLLPEVEAFGHTGYITRSTAYAHLLDRDPGGAADFTGVIPVHPESPQLFQSCSAKSPRSFRRNTCMAAAMR